jgi:hypothetical protein
VTAGVAAKFINRHSVTPLSPFTAGTSRLFLAYAADRHLSRKTFFTVLEGIVLVERELIKN